MAIIITIGSNSYNQVAVPLYPTAAAQIRIDMSDTVATVESPFTKALQTQNWPGADYWGATYTLPPLWDGESAEWEGFLGELRGRLNVFQMADPRRLRPRGNVRGSAPVVNNGTGGVNNAPFTTTLVTSGWRQNVSRVLLRGDRFQIGFRYHMVCEAVNSDSGGNASVIIWPSLREQPANGAALKLNDPMCLLRLQSNTRGVDASPGRLATISLPCEEVR